MLRAGYVDVALVFRHYQDGAAAGPPSDPTDGTRARLLLDDPIHLVTRAAGTAATPSHCQSAQTWPATRTSAGSAAASGAAATWSGSANWPGSAPKIAFTTDDFVAVQALVAAGLGVTTLPGLALRAARHPGIQTAVLPGSHRQVLAVTYGEGPDPPGIARLLDVLSQTAGTDHPAGAG